MRRRVKQKRCQLQEGGGILELTAVFTIRALLPSAQIGAVCVIKSKVSRSGCIVSDGSPSELASTEQDIDAGARLAAC